MSMIIELFGEDVVLVSLPEIKELIKTLPPTTRERRSYLLKEYAKIKNIELTQEDFSDIDA